MNKKLIFIISVFALLTGCSKQKIMTCNYDNIYSDIKSNFNYNIYHEGNDVKKVKIKYDYIKISNQNDDIDGVGTGTDGTTSDTQLDDNGIVDGIVGDAIDGIINGISNTILDLSGLKSRHNSVQELYSNINGFSYQNLDDNENEYHVTYTLDYDKISDDELNSLRLSRDLNSLRDILSSQGFTCK